MKKGDLKEYFDFLNDLRESGVVNMFGAAKNLYDKFELTMDEARSVLLEWMDSFNDEDDEAEDD